MLCFADHAMKFGLRVVVLSMMSVVGAGCEYVEHSASAMQRMQREGASKKLTLAPAQMKDLGLVIATVAEAPVDDLIRTSGRITYDDLRVAHVFSPVTGRVVGISAGYGQRVKQGAPLATIQSPDIGQASSDLAKADADMIAAQHDFTRKQNLRVVKAVSDADYEASKDAFRQATAEKQRAEQKASLLRAGGGIDLVSQRFTLTSPIDGEVVAQTINPGIEVQGQYSGAQSPVELFTIGEEGSLWVLADVYEKDMARVQVGAKVDVSVVSYPGRSFEGVVDWISGALDAVTRTVKVRCTLPNAEKLLRPEMYATVQISVSPVSRLAVPKKSVVTYGEQTIVFLRKPGADGASTIERWPVMVDMATPGGLAAVLHGLNQGDEVIADGAERLADML